MNDPQNVISQRTASINRVRGQLAMATRYNRPDMQAQYRKELSLLVIESTIDQRLAGQVISDDEFARLVRALMPYLDLAGVVVATDVEDEPAA